MKFNFNEFRSTVSNIAHINAEKIQPDTLIVEELGIESITMLNIIASLEDKYDIIFDELDFSDIKTASQAYHYLYQLIEKEQKEQEKEKENAS